MIEVNNKHTLCVWPRCVYHGKHSVLISGINKSVYTLEVYFFLFRYI